MAGRDDAGTGQLRAGTSPTEAATTATLGVVATTSVRPAPSRIATRIKWAELKSENVPVKAGLNELPLSVPCVRTIRDRTTAAAMATTPARLEYAATSYG